MYEHLYYFKIYEKVKKNFKVKTNIYEIKYIYCENRCKNR